MQPLGYYGNDRLDNEIFDEMMVQFGPTLERLGDREKFTIISDLTHALWFERSEGVNPPQHFDDMTEQLTDDGKLALLQALVEQLRESLRQQRIAGEVAIAAKNPV